MAFQDDSREKAQIKLFNLTAGGEDRFGIDAYLTLENGDQIPFELKTTIKGSVTTVRDFGYDHIKKWKSKHWLITKYQKDGKTMEYSLYGSPEMMATWINEKEEYISTDFELARIAPKNLVLADLNRIIGSKTAYTLADAMKLQKQQYTKETYLEMMDLTVAYSPKKMLEMLKDRCQYLMERGSTLNNPHIPRSYFEGWEHITENHADRLQELVTQALAKT